MTAQPLPAHIALFNEIISDLNALMREDVDEFTLAKQLNQLEAKALRVGEEHRGLGFSALGSVAAARGHEKKLRLFHERSLQFHDSPLLRRNFACSLFFAGKVEEAFDMALKAFEADQSDPETVSQLTALAMELGDEEGYLRFSKLYASLAGEPHPSWREYLAEVEESRQLNAQCMALAAQSLDAQRD